MFKQKNIIAIFFYFILLLSGLSCIKNYCDQITEKPMVVIIPSYNNIKWYEKNLSMLIAQSETYTNWRAIYIDDCSKDGTGNAVEKYIADHNLSNKITLIKNPQNMGAMSNWYHAIHSCKNEEIVISLDGDDWFPDNQVLKYVNSIYQDGKTWMTYGQFIIYPSGQIGCCAQIPNFVVEQNSFRTYAWRSSHLRTFYAGLFKKIKIEDFMLDGKFYSMSCDQAIMLPMLEMAGYHATFISKVLYVYNYNNPISDFRKDNSFQIYIEKLIRNKEKYNRIESIN